MLKNSKTSASTKEIGTKETTTLQILLKEYDALLNMYAQAEHNGQSMFNYYLTLMTAVFGGIAFIFQSSSNIGMQETAGGLLLVFFAVIGSLYLSSLSTNYAHMTRYALGMNEIRRNILKKFDVPLPPIYSKFMSEKDVDESSKLKFFSLFIPVNTFELFVATVNSISWAIAISIIYFSTGAGPQIIWSAPLSFVIMYLIYSVYARLIYQSTISRLNISIGH